MKSKSWKAAYCLLVDKEFRINLEAPSHKVNTSFPGFSMNTIAKGQNVTNLLKLRKKVPLSELDLVKKKTKN